MKKELATALVSLTIAASMAQAGDLRWHIYPAKSVLLDSDTNGQRLIMPQEYRIAELRLGAAQRAIGT